MSTTQRVKQAARCFFFWLGENRALSESLPTKSSGVSDVTKLEALLLLSLRLVLWSAVSSLIAPKETVVLCYR